MHQNWTHKPQSWIQTGTNYAKAIINTQGFASMAEPTVKFRETRGKIIWMHNDDQMSNFPANHHTTLAGNVEFVFKIVLGMSEAPTGARYPLATWWLRASWKALAYVAFVPLEAVRQWMWSNELPKEVFWPSEYRRAPGNAGRVWCSTRLELIVIPIHIRRWSVTGSIFGILLR